jgi:hypothetical protein
MYPADQIGVGYVSADLPDAITLRGVGSLSKSGTDYGNTTNGVILESGVWARYVGGVRTTKPCLFDGNGNKTPGDDAVEDQFEATYTIGWTFIGAQYSVEVERNSLCGWSYGPFPFPENPSHGDVFIPEASLFYLPRPQDPVPGVVYDVWLLKAAVSLAYDTGWGPDIGPPVIWLTNSSDYLKKTPHQESPAGDYELVGGSSFTDVTVT